MESRIISALAIPVSKAEENSTFPIHKNISKLIDHNIIKLVRMIFR